MIFYMFKPLNIKEQEFVDVPLFELKSFSLYELNEQGLKVLMQGNDALKFADRYEVQKIIFTDKDKDYISNMRADYGLYKNDILYLDGNVSYKKENGFSFSSEHVIYNQKLSLVSTNDNYLAYMNQNSMRGSSMRYNTRTNMMQSKHITINYKLEER